MTNQQKGVLLIGLLVAWGGVTMYQMSDFSDSSPTRSSNTSQPSGLPSIKDLALEESYPNARKSVRFSQPRNIFAPVSKPKIVVAKKPPKRTPLADHVAPSPPPQAPTPEGPSSGELATQRARQQLNQFRFLGYLKKGGESQAFLTKGHAIYIVKQGEILEGQIQVNKIEPETIVLSTQVWETGSQVQATIPLTPKT